MTVLRFVAPRSPGLRVAAGVHDSDHFDVIRLNTEKDGVWKPLDLMSANVFVNGGKESRHAADANKRFIDECAKLIAETDSLLFVPSSCVLDVVFDFWPELDCLMTDDAAAGS